MGVMGWTFNKRGRFNDLNECNVSTTSTRRSRFNERQRFNALNEQRVS